MRSHAGRINKQIQLKGRASEQNQTNNQIQIAVCELKQPAVSVY